MHGLLMDWCMQTDMHISNYTQRCMQTKRKQHSTMPLSMLHTPWKYLVLSKDSSEDSFQNPRQRIGWPIHKNKNTRLNATTLPQSSRTQITIPAKTFLRKATPSSQMHKPYMLPFKANARNTECTSTTDGPGKLLILDKQLHKQFVHVTTTGVNILLALKFHF